MFTYKEPNVPGKIHKGEKNTNWTIHHRVSEVTGAQTLYPCDFRGCDLKGCKVFVTLKIPIE